MRIVKMLLSVALVGVLGTGAFFGYNYYAAKDIFNEKVYVNKTSKDRESFHDNKVNILVLGSDTRGSKLGKERADTILVANVDLDNKKINLMSVPRDTKVQIKNRTHKINQAHALGGPELMQEEVEKLTGLEIDYFVETNFEGFKEVIDVIGGIKLDVEKRMYKPTEDIDLRPGLQKLNGRQALGYVRWRGDARADLARVERQQKFFKTLLDQTATIANLPKIPKIINAVGDNVLTDMSFDEIMQVSKNVITGEFAFNSFTLPGTPKTIGGASYFVADEDAIKQYMLAMNEGNLTDDMMTNILAMTSKNHKNTAETKSTTKRKSSSTTKQNQTTAKDKPSTSQSAAKPVQDINDKTEQNSNPTDADNPEKAPQNNSTDNTASGETKKPQTNPNEQGSPDQGNPTGAEQTPSKSGSSDGGSTRPDSSDNQSSKDSTLPVPGV